MAAVDNGPMLNARSFTFDGIHGFTDLIGSKSRISRIAWIMAIAGAVVLLCRQTIAVFQPFLREDITSEVTVWTPPQIFPITLCPAHYLSTPKTMSNFPGMSTLEATILNAYMDGYLSLGSLAKTAGATSPVEDMETAGVSGAMVNAARGVARKYGVWDRYNGSLEGFMRESSFKPNEVFRRIGVHPLKASIAVTTHYTWFGTCYTLRVTRRFSNVQTQFLSINIKLKLLPSDGILELVRQFGSPEITAHFRNLTGQVELHRLGSEVYRGVLESPIQVLRHGNLYNVAVTPKVTHFANLRKRRCEQYTSADAFLHCVFSKLRAKCSCRYIFPGERLSRDFNDCNYWHAGKYCITTMTTSDEFGLPPCSWPCTLLDGSMAVGTPKPSNETQVRITFDLSRAIEIRERLVVDVYQLLSYWVA